MLFATDALFFDTIHFKITAVGWRSKDFKHKIMRKILIELQIDWEGYEDVSDELIVEDAIEQKADGVVRIGETVNDKYVELK